MRIAMNTVVIFKGWETAQYRAEQTYNGCRQWGLVENNIS